MNNWRRWDGTYNLPGEKVIVDVIFNDGSKGRGLVAIFNWGLRGISEDIFKFRVADMLADHDWIYRDAIGYFPQSVETSTRMVEVECDDGCKYTGRANCYGWVKNEKGSDIKRCRFIEEEKAKLPESFWLVWCSSEGGKEPTFRHASVMSAKAEAERLAKLHTGKEFVVLQSVAHVKASSVVWERHFNDEDQFVDDIPF